MQCTEVSALGRGAFAFRSDGQVVTILPLAYVVFHMPIFHIQADSTTSPAIGSAGGRENGGAGHYGGAQDDVLGSKKDIASLSSPSDWPSGLSLASKAAVP